MNNKMKTFALLGVIILVLVGGSLAYNRLREQVEPERTLATSDSDATDTDAVTEAYPQARDFTVQDIDGNDVKLSEQFGKPLVVNFWASWCPPCKEEMPDFDSVYQEMGEQVTFMMVNLVDGSRETLETATDYITANGYTFPIYFDINQDAAYTYTITSIPTTLFINAKGEIVTSAVGAIDAEVLKQGIRAISE